MGAAHTSVARFFLNAVANPGWCEIACITLRSKLQQRTATPLNKKRRLVVLFILGPPLTLTSARTMLKQLLRRGFRFAGRWLADGARESVPQQIKLWGEEEGVIFKKTAQYLDNIHVHTWQSKEFQSVAFEDYLIALQMKKFGDRYIAKYSTHLFSQTYEDATISEIFSRIGVQHKTFLEIGVGDGSENTTRLLLMLGWKGLWIECDAIHCESIRNNFHGEIVSGRLQLIHAMATPNSIQSLIDSAKLGEQIDFLSVDVDQHTSHLFRAIKTPARVACVEYNAHFPPTIDYEVPYKPDEVWDGTNWFGASLKRIEIEGEKKGMVLVGCDLMGVNSYFVKEDLAGGKFATPFTAEYHYQPPRFSFVRGQRGHKRRPVNASNSY
ncbi:hypothetical protein [Paraburkholderia sp. CNPSo 3281]|uniref:hypothetical protein n=1 Tax=Paraburkholderia sp. CNPSo 3281 TaxID=2940933 RepID=UPI0020B73B36|nr:hypothetical protein [Paraburkholderia sp. CNPSo 3281]MCP3718734.1 hypothetical protein [Paraburkholderia sp. CNPSo 3281]